MAAKRDEHDGELEFAGLPAGPGQTCGNHAHFASLGGRASEGDAGCHLRGSVSMRILHVAQSISGGIASYFEEIAGYQNRLCGEGAVRFLIPQGGRHHLPSVASEQIVEFAPTQRSLRGLYALGRALHAELRKFDPDVLHLHSTFAGAIGRPVALLGGRRRRIIYCPHGWVFAMELPSWKRNLYALIERCLVPLTDSIINISHADHQLARMSGIRTSKMITIRNGIAALPPRVKELEPLKPRGDINLIFVGRHDRQKGLDVLLRVFAENRLAGINLHVVGAPVLSKRGGAVAIAELPANVTFHGWKCREEVSALIASADALIVPSRWEGFGLVAVEAMRMGKPVIASRRGGLAEVVQHGVTGLLFDVEDRDELVRVLRGLDRATLRELGSAGRKRFLEAFTADRLNGELMSLYFSLVEGSRTKAAPATLPAGGRVVKHWSEKFGG